MQGRGVNSDNRKIRECGGCSASPEQSEVPIRHVDMRRRFRQYGLVPTRKPLITVTMLPGGTRLITDISLRAALLVCCIADTPK